MTCPDAKPIPARSGRAKRPYGMGDIRYREGKQLDGRVKLTSAVEARAGAPSAFGVFGVVLDGELLAYHYLLEKDLVALISART